MVAGNWDRAGVVWHQIIWLPAFPHLPLSCIPCISLALLSDYQPFHKAIELHPQKVDSWWKIVQILCPNVVHTILWNVDKKVWFGSPSTWKCLRSGREIREWEIRGWEMWDNMRVRKMGREYVESCFSQPVSDLGVPACLLVRHDITHSPLIATATIHPRQKTFQRVFIWKVGSDFWRVTPSGLDTAQAVLKSLVVLQYNF